MIYISAMKLTLCLLLSVFSLFASAQRPSPQTVINVPNRHVVDPISIPFSTVEVLDARFDQSKIGNVFGIVGLGMVNSEKCNAVFPDSLTKYLPHVLQGAWNLSPASADTLCILVKQFRIADYFSVSIVGSMQPQLILYFSASFYARKNGLLYKLFSVDDAAMNNFDFFKETKTYKHSKTRSDALIYMLYKLTSNKNWQTNVTQHPFTETEMQQAIEKRFTSVSGTQNTTAGLYKTFAEFKTGKPIPNQLQFIYNDGRLAEVQNEKGETVDVKAYWGLCDGTKNYIIFRQQLKELLPSDRGYRILSYRTYADVKGKVNFTEEATTDGLLPALLNKLNSSVRFREYFDVNMDTGAVNLEEVFGISGVKELQKELLH